MQVIETLQKANLGVVEHATDWEWAVHKGPTDKYQFVTTKGEGMLLRITDLGRKPTYEELTLLRESGIALGALEQIDVLYYEVKFNYSELFSHFDLSADGRIDFSNPQSFPLANAYFHNAVLATERFVVQVGAIIGKVFGKDSKQSHQWKSQKREIEKINMPFGYCLEERNHIQHALRPLAAIDVNPLTLHGGLGVNLESDYTEYDRRGMNKDYKRLRDEFVKKRTSQGKRPFLSISGILPAIQMAIILLLSETYEILEEPLCQRIDAATQLGANLGHNGLLIIPKQDDCPAYAQPRRVLRWENSQQRNNLRKRIEQLETCIKSIGNDPSFKERARGMCFLP